RKKRNKLEYQHKKECWRRCGSGRETSAALVCLRDCCGRHDPLNTCSHQLSSSPAWLEAYSKLIGMKLARSSALKLTISSSPSGSVTFEVTGACPIAWAAAICGPGSSKVFRNISACSGDPEFRVMP